MIHSFVGLIRPGNSSKNRPTDYTDLIEIEGDPATDQNNARRRLACLSLDHRRRGRRSQRTLPLRRNVRVFVVRDDHLRFDSSFCRNLTLFSVRGLVVCRSSTRSSSDWRPFHVERCFNHGPLPVLHWPIHLNCRFYSVTIAQSSDGRRG